MGRERWVVLWLAGCDAASPSDGGPPEVVCDVPLALEVGTGEFSFQTMSPEESVRMVHGPQGGWHLEVAGRMTTPTPQVLILPQLHLGDRRLAGDQTAAPVALVGWDDETCTGDFYGARAYIDDEIPGLPDEADVITDYICTLAGAAVELTVDVTPLGSEEPATDALALTLALDLDDVPLCGASAR